MVAQLRADYPSEGAAIADVARQVGIGSPETLRKWVRQECNSKECPKAKTNTCKCSCRGHFHGSASRSPPTRVTWTPPEVQPAPQQSSTALRRVILTIAAVATPTIGPFVIKEYVNSSWP